MVSIRRLLQTAAATALLLYTVAASPLAGRGESDDGDETEEPQIYADAFSNLGCGTRDPGDLLERLRPGRGRQAGPPERKFGSRHACRPFAPGTRSLLVHGVGAGSTREKPNGDGDGDEGGSSSSSRSRLLIFRDSLACGRDAHPRRNPPVHAAVVDPETPHGGCLMAPAPHPLIVHKGTGLGWYRVESCGGLLEPACEGQDFWGKAG